MQELLDVAPRFKASLSDSAVGHGKGARCSSGLFGRLPRLSQPNTGIGRHSGNSGMLLCCATNRPIDRSADDFVSHSDTPEHRTELFVFEHCTSYLHFARRRQKAENCISFATAEDNAFQGRLHKKHLLRTFTPKALFFTCPSPDTARSTLLPLLMSLHLNPTTKSLTTLA